MRRSERPYTIILLLLGTVVHFQSEFLIASVFIAMEYNTIKWNERILCKVQDLTTKFVPVSKES
jgi:hypothetical protein